MWAASEPLAATPEQVEQLRNWVRAPSTQQRVVLRSKIVLSAIEGMANHAIAKKHGVSRPTVLLWRGRFAEGGPEALRKELPRRGPPRLAPEKVQAVVKATLHTKPPNATHWSVRTMAKAQGISPAAVQRIWSAHGLKPHLVKTFKLSNDPKFVEKLHDVVGLYLNPPERALVLSIDEKSQIQALDRTQPGLPLKKGRAGTRTHDYKRNGTTTLFAALNVLDGTVIGECMSRHRHQEFLRFMRQVVRQTPEALELHVILDNYATHKHPAVKRWLKKNPRVHFHFIPTSSSWLNLVERWFRDITDKAIRRGVFHSVQALEVAIDVYIAGHNSDPKPFVWTATAEKIIDKVTRGKAKLETLH
jgi:transposase